MKAIKRVFAEIEDPTDDLWGAHCPSCRVFHSFERPDRHGGETQCLDCGRFFIVSFVA